MQPIIIKINFINYYGNTIKTAYIISTIKKLTSLKVPVNKTTISCPVYGLSTFSLDELLSLGNNFT